MPIIVIHGQTLPLGAEVDNFVFCGGSYELLKDNLEQLSKDYSAPILECPVADELTKYLVWRKSPDLPRFKKENLKYRFADAWGFFTHFAQYDLKRILNAETGVEVNQESINPSKYI